MPQPTPPPATHTDSGGYSDRFITLSSTSHTLTIHHFLPLHRTLHLPLSSIHSLLPAPEATQRLSMRAWGVGYTGVAWAKDWKRLGRGWEAYERGFVVRYEGAWFRAGFSVEDKDAFVRAVEKLCPGILSRREDIGEEGSKLKNTGYIPLRGFDAGKVKVD